MKRKLISVALSGAFAFPFAVFADEPMELTIVTPARMAQPLDQTVTDTTVLDEQDIRNSGATDVPSLLHNLAGVEVAQSGGLGNMSSTFMRGTNSSHVLVLLDGVRINSATAGTTALEHLMLDSIERIEVVRGNVSSLYGSEAIGGVIQIFTKQGHGAPAFNASIGAGSHNTQRLSVSASGTADADSYSVNVGKVKTDGISAINTDIAPAANPDKDGYDNTTINAQLKHAFNANHQLTASWLNTSGNSQYDSPFNLAVTDTNSTKVILEKVALTADDQFSAAWHSRVNWARGTDDSRDYLNDNANGRIKTVNSQLGWQNDLQIADHQRINLAAEHLNQSVDSDTQYTQTTRSVNSLLGGYVGEYGAQQAQLNLRHDRYSDFGTANTGLLGYGFAFADGWRATASVSNAFKAPTFNDMYGPVFWGSNPSLLPERANNREIGLRYAAHGQHASLIYFDNRIHDLINYPAPAYTAQNVDRARIDGYELSYDAQFGTTAIKAEGTLQNPRDTGTGQALLRRAKEFGGVQVYSQFGNWSAGGEWKVSGKREDIDINTYARMTLGGYSYVNLSAGYAFGKQLKLNARLDNIFNRKYMIVDGYNTLGRTVFVGLSYQP